MAVALSFDRTRLVCGFVPQTARLREGQNLASLLESLRRVFKQDLHSSGVDLQTESESQDGSFEITYRGHGRVGRLRVVGKHVDDRVNIDAELEVRDLGANNPSGGMALNQKP